MSAGYTEGPWQTKHDYSLEGLATIIANVDGEIIEGGNHYTYDTVAICADEFGEYLPNAASNTRLIVAACNSYDRHFGPRAIEAAEADLLGRALEALRMAAPLLAEAREALCGRDDVCTTSDGDDALLPLRDAINFILSQAREVK